MVATFLAQFWGVSFLILGVIFFIRRENISKLLKVVDDQTLMILAGYGSLSIGIAHVLLYNVWEPDWRGVVTLIGWLALIKGVMLLAFPNMVKKMAKSYQKETFITAALAIMLLVGIYLCVRGFGL